MQGESLALHEALLLAFFVSALGLIGQVAFRWYERKQLDRQALIDRVYAELSVAEGVMYRVRIALVKTAVEHKKLSRFEAEEYIFGPVIAQSRITSLDLDLRQKGIDAADLVVRIHAHRKYCIEFLLGHDPENIEIESRAFLAPMTHGEWGRLKESAYSVIRRISCMR